MPATTTYFPSFLQTTDRDAEIIYKLQEHRKSVVQFAQF
jgi:hypothetical protein